MVGSIVGSMVGPVAVAALAVAGALVGASPAAAAPGGTADRYVSVDTGRLIVPVASGVLANDGGGPDRRAERASRPSHGSVQLAADGSFTYRATTGYEGPDAFTYRVVDASGSSAPITVDLVVNRPPRTADDAYQIGQNGRLRLPYPGIQSNDVDLVGAPMETYLVQQAAHGQAVVGVRGGAGYTPDPGFRGVDRFRYAARDAYGRWSLAATVTVRVGANRAPVAVVDDGLTMAEDSILEIAAPGLLANDTDLDGDQLTAELVGFSSGGSVDLQPDGSLVVGTDVNADRDITFRYRVTDGLAWSAPVDVTIDVIAENDPPVAEPDQYEAFVGFPLEVFAPGVLANDSDPVEFDGLRAQLISGPSSGTLDLRDDGSFTYVPDPGPSRSDNFAYAACDSGGCTPSSVDLWVYGDDA